MKTIEQLLALTKNPYYIFRPEEKELLDNFLSKKQAKDSKTSQTKSSSKSTDNTNVRVRNIVETTVPDVQDIKSYDVLPSQDASESVSE